MRKKKCWEERVGLGITTEWDGINNGVMQKSCKKVAKLLKVGLPTALSISLTTKSLH